MLSSGSRVPFSRRPLPLLAALALVVSAFALAACGGGGGGSAGADPADVAPKNSLLYFAAAVRPEGDQKEAIDSIAKKVLGVDDPGERIQTLLDEAIKKSGSKLSYADDIEPWLGERAAVAVTSLDTQGDDSQVAVIFASKDNDKARDAISKAADEESPKLARRSYQEVEYRLDAGENTAAGVVDDYVVLGTEAGFKAVVDASKGDGLSDNEKFKKASGDADDKLGFGYVDTRAFVSALGTQGRIPGGAQSLQGVLGNVNEPVTMSLDATSNKVTLEAIAAATEQAKQAEQSELLPELPGDSWLGLGLPNLGASIKQSLDQLGGGVGAGIIETAKEQIKTQTGLDVDRDVLASLGDLALFVRGSGVLTVGGGVVIKSDDPKAAARLLDKLEPLIRRQGASSGLRVSGTNIDGAKGIKISSPKIPGSINAVLKGDRLVIAYTDAATREALSPQSKLGDAPEFQQATQSLGGAVPALYVAFAPIAELAATASPESAAQIKQYLGAFTTMAAGTQVKGNQQIGRFVVNLK